MWYWLFKYIFMGPLLSLLGRPKVEGLEYVPDAGPASWPVTTWRSRTASTCRWWCGAASRSWPRPSTSPAPASRAGSSAGSTPRPGRCPIDRTDADSAQAALDTAERLLNEGKLLGMYPEGTRSPDGRLYKGKTGLARVALRDRRASHPGRDDRHRRGQPAGQQDVAVRPGHGPVRQADGLQPVRGPGGQPVHRAGGRRRGDLRADAAVRVRSTSTCTPPTSRRVNNPPRSSLPSSSAAYRRGVPLTAAGRERSGRARSPSRRPR